MPPAEQPPYLRIAAELRARIVSGELRPGDPVPSTRRITQEWGVAMATATKVLGALRRQGLVESRPGVGTAVAARLPELPLESPPAGAPDPTAPAPAPAPAPTAPVPAPTPARRREPHAAAEAAPAPAPAPGLTRERIVQAAIALADEEDLTTLTMRGVAARLGAAPMALYRHVANKEELVDLMADAVLGSEPLPPAELTGWRPRLAALARLQWSLYRRHPWLASCISLTRPVPLPGALRHGEYVLGSIEPYGLPPATRLYFHIMMFAVVRGLAVNLELQSRDRDLTSEEWMASQEQALVAVLGTGRFPLFGELMVEFDQSAGADDFELDLDHLFEFVLERLLDGLAVYFAD
ncbi:GntR family transcriptional regulator [Kitasatospora sp. LaBMicrA B282]|uniref:GntR family transcriptional regulator n=1 Tax=Kitasatospora sp. LaBMicrA B282 TaxID=3420949 RepID=UPI003D0D56F6